jgi:DNA-binding transcriptional MerR regulator
MSANGRKSYLIKELATLSGVSVRTLRFYDEIGLFKPSSYGENGYRYYDRDQLFILQQILFYRELGMELSHIQNIMGDPSFDKVKALRKHREILVQQSRRTQELISTIDKTLAHLEEETPMKVHEIYKGFDTKKLEEYVAWTRHRFGDKVADGYKQSMLDWQRKNPDWPNEEAEKMKDTYDELHRCFTDCLQKNLPANATQVQELVARHFKMILRFWTPDRRSYTTLGEIYCEHPDYRKLYDPYHPKLAEYLAEAMKVYAEGNLAT